MCADFLSLLFVFLKPCAQKTLNGKGAIITFYYDLLDLLHDIVLQGNAACTLTKRVNLPQSNE